MPYNNKRSPEAQKRRDELAEQKQIAKWLVNGTRYHDLVNKETVVTFETEDVYAYIKDVCGQEPNPRCVPQQIDGTVTDIPNLYHFELFPVTPDDGLS